MCIEHKFRNNKNKDNFCIGSKTLRNKESGKKIYREMFNNTVCPKSIDPFYMISYNMKWVTASWTYSNNFDLRRQYLR